MTPANLAFAARHSMDTPEWYTPSPIVEAARDVMGGIDLDPASHAEANARIQATEFFGIEENGLLRLWRGRVFLNPPGGLVAEFWRKALLEWQHARIEQLIWIGYSLEQLQTLQQRDPITPLNFPTCITAKRIAFIENEAKRAERVAKQIAAGKKPSTGSSPSHSNYVSYIGPHRDRFAQLFRSLGQVVNA